MLLFAVHFLEAFIQSKINPELDKYILSLVAAAYYVASLPGSSLVYSKRLRVDFEHEMTLSFLNSILITNLSISDIEHGRKRWLVIGEVLQLFQTFYESERQIDNIYERIKYLRNFSYNYFGSFDLLITDLACAIIKLKINNSVWEVIPRSSNLPVEKWKPIFLKEGFFYYLKQILPQIFLMG